MNNTSYSPNYSTVLAEDGITPVSTADPHLLKAQHTNFAPRFGAAWSPNAKTSIRTGYGIFYGGLESVGYWPNLGENYPFQFTGTFNPASCGANLCPSDGFTIANGFSSIIAAGFASNTTGLTMRGMETNPKTPYTEGWNFAVERSITNDMVVTASYVGNTGRHLIALVDANSHLAAAALFGDAQYAQAIPVFAGLLESEPDNGEYAGMLGVSCTTVMQEARPQCTVLVHYAETHPKDARASAYAAAFLLDQSDSQSLRPLARKLLEAALAADPKLPEAQFRMGRFLQDDQMWKESIPYLERAVELKPDYSTAHYRLARAYWRTGRKQDGDAQIELQKKFSRQEAEDLDRRLRQITRFVTENH